MAILNGSRSNFPDSMDSFTEVYDLTQDKIARARKLQELKSKAVLSTSEQQEVLSIQAELRENIFTAEDWNRMGDALYAMQKHYNSEVHGYLDKKQKEWNTYVQDFNVKGDWRAGVQYKAQNLVTMPDGGMYIAKVTHTSSTANQPTEDTSNATWGFIGARGKKGDTGVVANYQGNWVSSRNYNLGDGVTHVHQGVNGGLVYVAKRANTNKPPMTSPDDWQLITQVWTARTEPLGAQAGTHWIKELD